MISNITLDNCYYIPNLYFEGRVLKTNHVSHTAFRGFGGPQGMLVVEEAMNRLAEYLNVDPVVVRKKNYYGNTFNLLSGQHKGSFSPF